MSARARLGAAVAALAVSVGCSAPVPEASPQPLPELAEPAAPLPADQQPGDGPGSPGAASSPEPAGSTTPSPVATPSPAQDPSPTGAGPPTQTDEPVASPSPTATERAVTTLVTIGDRTGDAGLEAPDHADLVQVVLEDTGTNARVTVDVADDLPDPLGEGEVVGLGIDLYTSGAAESDYQLFADGGSDGWRAYLQTPEGFVDFPGTFAIGGRRLRFEVPWTALGAPVDGEVSTFLDWSQARTVVNASSSDRAPGDGRASFERT